MSKGDVTIELARPGALRCGEVVEGNVVVVVDQDVQANHVEIELDWFTHGKGNRVARTVEKTRIEGGAWAAGRTLRLPFRFSIPAVGPTTFRGSLINLDWQVKARVELPWAVDLRASEDFVVVAGEHTVPLLETASQVSGAPPSKAEPGCLTVLLVPFLIAGPTTLVGGLVNLDPFSALGWLAYLGISGFAVFAVWKKVLAHAAVGNVSLTVKAEQVRAGEEVVFSVELPARVAPKLLAVTGSLEGAECAVSGSGTQTTTHTESIYKTDVALTRTKGATGPRFEGRARIPDDAKGTLRVADNTVTWQVKVNADIAGLLDPSWAR